MNTGIAGNFFVTLCFNLICMITGKIIFMHQRLTKMHFISTDSS